MSKLGETAPVHVTAEPLPVFTWDTYQTDEDGVIFGASGATTDKSHAVQALGDALQGLPVGTTGVIWRADLDLIGTVRYEYRGIIARAERDAASGCVTWSKGSTVEMDSP